MAFGTIKWFNSEKGFGFIEPTDGSKDIFVHVTNVQGGPATHLDEGSKVEFELGEGRKGPEAKDVRLA